jgi:hypothetical protein
MVTLIQPFFNVGEGEMAKTRTKVETLYYMMWPKHPVLKHINCGG